MGEQPNTPISQKLILLLIRAKRHMYTASEPWGLTPVQGTLLMLLHPGVAKTMNELANMMVCDASNITGLIDKLEAAGYIERTADQKDRRIKKIQLSKAGLTCREAILADLDKSEALGLQSLSEDETKALHSITSKLAL